MAKVKERKSESWKPGVHHDDGFISKNKKRKDKRMSLNLSAKKIDTDEFIPIKKSFPAFNKSKDGLGTTPSKFLSPALERKQTPKKKDTPLPTSGKKQDAASNMRKFSLSHISKELNGSPNVKKEPFGTPKGKAGFAGTPKVKTEPFGTPKIKLENTTPKSKPTPVGTPKANVEPVIKSALKKKAQEFIDHEAEQGEEPITDKEVKPYVKGAAKRKKSISFQSPIDDESDSSDSDESDSDEMTSARDFLDNEASEGEETDDGEIDEQDSDDDDDDSDAFEFMGGDDDDDELDEEDSDEDGEEEEDDEDDSDEPDSDESDDQVQLPKLQANKKPDIKALMKNIVEQDTDEMSSDDEIEEQSSKPKALLSQIKKQIPEKPAPKAAPQLTANQIKKEKIEKTPKVNEPAAKKPKVEPKEQKSTADETPAASEYAGYIKFLPNTITADQIKSQLATQISPKNIVSIVLKKNNTKKSNKCLVYVTDEDTLDKLENKTYTIGETKFKVFKARESKKPEKNTPLAFLPRVPLTIDNDKIKSIIEADIGAGNVKTLKSKKTNEKLQTRNVIIEVANEDILKKIIYKGSYTCNGTDLVVRQAFESGFQIPIYKIVFSGVPENTTEALIKKAVEMKIGKGSVMAVKFSFRKKSFAFVTLNSEQAQKKLLDPSAQVTINGTKLQTLEFKPRLPKTKRGPAKKKPQGAPPAKKQKIDPKSSAENKPKKAPKPDVGAGSPAKKQQQQQQTSQQQNKPKQPTQNNAQASPQQQQNNQSSKKQKKQKQQQQKKQNQQQQPGSSPQQQQQQKKQNQQQNQKPGSPQQQQKKQKQQQQQQKSGSPQQQQKPKQQQQQQQPGSNQSSPKKNKNKKAKNKAPNQNQPQTPDKKANLSNKLEAKKEKLKNKKNKKKQADTSI